MWPGQDFRSTVESLTSIGSGEHSGRDGSPVYRGSTTAGERLAADALTERLSAGGWQVQRQRFTGHSSFGARFLVHLAAVTAALAFIPFAPGVTLAVTLVAAPVPLCGAIEAGQGSEPAAPDGAFPKPPGTPAVT